MQAWQLPAAVPSAFYRRVDATLGSMDFARQGWEIAAPAYAEAARGGRPGIDPGSPATDLFIPLRRLGGVFENAHGRLF